MDTGLSIVIGISVGAVVCFGLAWLGDKQNDENKDTEETQSSEFRV